VDAYSVHFVDSNHKLGHAERTCKEGVLLGLSLRSEARFKLARTGVDHEHCGICLCCAADLSEEGEGLCGRERHFSW